MITIGKCCLSCKHSGLHNNKLTYCELNKLDDNGKKIWIHQMCYCDSFQYDYSRCLNSMKKANIKPVFESNTL